MHDTNAQQSMKAKQCANKLLVDEVNEMLNIEVRGQRDMIFASFDIYDNAHSLSADLMKDIYH